MVTYVCFSFSSQHTPGSYYHKSTSSEEYCTILLSAEVTNDSGAKGLNCIIQMPSNPDILVCRGTPNDTYKRIAHKAMRDKYDLVIVRQWWIKQAKRQIFLFSILIRKLTYTQKQLEEKLKLYLNKLIVKNVFRKAMIRDANREITFAGETKT
jgi:hypothetical protein